MAPIRTVVRSIFGIKLRRAFYLVAVILKCETPNRRASIVVTFFAATGAHPGPAEFLLARPTMGPRPGNTPSSAGLRPGPAAVTVANGDEEGRIGLRPLGPP